MNRRAFFLGAAGALLASPAVAGRRRRRTQTSSRRRDRRPANTVAVVGTFAVGTILLVSMLDGSELHCRVIESGPTGSICAPI